MTTQFILQNWYLFAGIAIVLFMLFGSGLIQRIYGVTQLPAARAVQIANRDSGAFLDVREPNEYAAGHIPRAVHIPLSQLAGRLAELESLKSRPLIVYCRSGNRSGRAAVLLRRRGFESVHNLAGGILAWQGENLPLRKA